MLLRLFWEYGVLLGLITTWLPFSGATTLSICGGSVSGTNVAWSHLLDLAGGTNARMGIITAASADPEDSANYYIDLFTNLGAQSVYWVPIHELTADLNNDPTIAAEIRQQTGFFFSGGDQARIINSFYNNGREESETLRAIRETYEAGAMASGSSAGLACMSRNPMIMGGMSWEALRYGASTTCGSDRLCYDTDGGIGFMDGYILDSHYSERGREGRLTRLIWDTRQLSRGTMYGIGVDEGTCFTVTNVNTPSAVGEVVGTEGAMVVDLSRARERSGTYFSITDVYIHYLTEGDRINLDRDGHNISFASYKNNLIGDERYTDPLTSFMIFNGDRADRNSLPEFRRVTTSIFDARGFTTYGTTLNSGPTYRVTFRQESSSRGFGGYNPRTDRWLISYGGLHMDIDFIDDL